MKVLLCEAPYNYGPFKIAIERYFPWGIGYINAYLNSNNIESEIFLGNIDKFQEKLCRENFDIIGISSMSPSFLNAIKMARIAKNRTKAAVVIGGQHASAVGEGIVGELPDFDYLIYNEGERTFLELCRGLNNPDKGNINGLIWRTNGRAISNPPRPLIEDLDSLPFPRKELTDNIARLGAHAYVKFGKTVSLITSRGCPYQCIFCSSHKTMGNRYRYHSAEYIISNIEYLHRDRKVTGVVFWDDNFTSSHERTEEICRGIIKKKLKIQWCCLSRIESASEDLLTLMQEAGLRMISFGIESGNDRIQKRLNKVIPFTRADRIIRFCEGKGIRTQASFILGFPFETVGDIKDTVRYARKLSPTITIFFPLIPYPGSEIFKSLPASIAPPSIHDWVKRIPTNSKVHSYNENISSRILSRLINGAYIIFYLRPKQLIRIARTIRSPREAVGYIRAGLGLFFMDIGCIYVFFREFKRRKYKYPD